MVAVLEVARVIK